MTEKTQGHGYFRKKKWAKGLASGIAVAGIVAFSAGSAFADEAVQPESKNDNNMYATQAGKATGSQSVAIDNTAVSKAAEKAKAAGVNVSEGHPVDKGTDTTAPKLEQSKSEIKQDQDKQVQELEATTTKQVQNNEAFKEAQEAIHANNKFVADEKAKHGGETTVSVTNDSSTATDGTADQNKKATQTAKQVLSDNQQAVTKYLGEKSKYDATVKQATILNQAVSAELVKAKNPVKPTLALKTLSETKNQKLSASYHGYKLQYKPVVRKSVADTDKTNTNGQTVAKNATQLYTLHHDNIYANLKKGDKITIIDPLEAGAVPDVAVTKAAAEKAGWGVAYDAGKNTYTFTATYEGKRLAAPVITWKPIYDKGFYDNTYKVLVNKYEVYSNTVTTKTPKPPKPVKAVLDRSGKDINGATTFDRNVTFRLVTDYSPYTKTLASAQALGKKFAVLDDVQDGAFSVYQGNIKMTAAGQDVKNLFDMYHVLSDKGRTDAIKNILKELNLQPRGEFYLWVAKDSKSFYQNYVKQNKNVTIDLPAKLLVKAGEKVENDLKQIDFGNSYQSNLVTVEVPDVKPEKHALDQKDNKKVLDGQEVQIGQYIRYLLDGVTVPTKHDSIFQYDGIDQLDVVHDRFTGKWEGIFKGTEYTASKDLILPYDVILKDGKVVKAGEKIVKGTAYAFLFEVNQDTDPNFLKKIVTVKWDEKAGKWSYVINQDFLNSLGVKGSFDADFYIEVERIAAGKVENTFINTVNSQEMTAKVTTTTPEPPKPEEPGKPNPQPSLPNTGSAASMLPVVGMILGLLSLVGLRKYKK